MEPNMNMDTPVQQEEKKPVGAVIGIIIIVLVLAIGAFFFLMQVPVPSENSQVSPVTANTQRVPVQDPTISALSTQGASTDIADIERDLSASDFSTLDMGLSSVSI